MAGHLLHQAKRTKNYVSDFWEMFVNDLCVTKSEFLLMFFLGIEGNISEHVKIL